jgi:hypothetical protein
VLRVLDFAVGQAMRLDLGRAIDVNVNFKRIEPDKAALLRSLNPMTP